MPATLTALPRRTLLGAVAGVLATPAIPAWAAPAPRLDLVATFPGRQVTGVAVSPTGRVTGTYVHGLFADDRQRAAWLARFAAGAPALDYEAGVESALDALAAHVATHLDLDRLLSLAR